MLSVREPSCQSCDIERFLIVAALSTKRKLNGAAASSDLLVCVSASVDCPSFACALGGKKAATIASAVMAIMFRFMVPSPDRKAEQSRALLGNEDANGAAHPHKKFKVRISPQHIVMFESSHGRTRVSLFSKVSKLAFAVVCVATISSAAFASPAKNISLSVMTYNVHGLPWPFASNRDVAFEKIETRLSALRKENAQPHIIVLQEAFTARAKRIAARSGYPFIASGPSKDMINTTRPAREDLGFVKGASFFKGETSGKSLDSGLQIASDYPILSVKRAAFPAFACAGYDCLANKGVLLVTVAVPGSDTPVTIATTHMNSKRASGVSQSRSLHAYQLQIAAIDAFLSANRDPNLPIVFAGDFNASSTARRSYLLDEGTTKWSAFPVRSALQNCMAIATLEGKKMDDLANYVVERGRDWQFYASGMGSHITATKFEIPFGRERDGTMLSDHVGYGIFYELQRTT
jgi:endonuclease/exonuclease/phosphatase family metal-dependent hydrolase